MGTLEKPSFISNECFARLTSDIPCGYQIKESLIFSTLYGSKLYGTDGPNSDTDIRGVFIPSMKDLLLDRAPKHMTIKNDEQDVSYLSLHYFLQLLTQGETNCLDMFFSYTNKKAQISNSPWYEQLIENKGKLITSNVAKYLGYCRSQAIKYSLKGDRIQNLEALMEFCQKHKGSVLLRDALQEAGYLISTEICVNTSTEYLKNNKRVGIRTRLDGTPFGEHVYLLFCDNLEEYYMVSDHRFPLNGNINTTVDSIKKCLNSYGKRAVNAAEDNGADYKALSHALRVAYQAEELLTTGEVHFPLQGDNLATVRAIKFKTTNLTYDQIVEMIEEKIRLIEQLLTKTTLPTKPDTKWIEDFILSVYGFQPLTVGGTK